MLDKERNHAEAGGLSFINVIDGHLRVVTRLKLSKEVAMPTNLELALFYDNARAGVLHFELQHYSPTESIALARNIKGCEFLMREIDDYLCGDVID